MAKSALRSAIIRSPINGLPPLLFHGSIEALGVAKRAKNQIRIVTSCCIAFS